MASLRRRGGLTDEAVRGLYGELSCLTRVAYRLGWGAAVSAWGGPDNGIHDITANGGAWEVKTSLGAGSAVWINGLDQLNDVGLSGLTLVHVTLSLDPAGRSLKDVAQSARTSVSAGAPAAIAEFERKLMAAGFLGTEAAAEVPFRVTATSFYRVVDGFPRILRGDVSTGISEARYQIQVAALAAHALDPDQALDIVSAGVGL